MSKTSPSNEADPSIIVAFNRIIANTVEHSFIFFGLFTFCMIDLNGGILMFNLDQIFPSIFLVNIGSWFILGRWLFSAGYIAGTLIDFAQLRAYGFRLTLLCHILII